MDKAEDCEQAWLIFVFIVKILEWPDSEFEGWFKEVTLGLKRLIIYQKWLCETSREHI